jgi:aryl-alcohol dehydrogenase-like predicted oxidoreductase
MDDKVLPSAALPATLVLGTAQLGMAYGIANRTGAPAPAAAQALIARALALGVTQFDTARAYGESEARLGQALAAAPGARVVTKLAALDELALDAPAASVIAATRASVEASATALGRPRLDVLLLHRTRHLRLHNGAVWDTLLNLQSEGRIGVLGASVQTPEELRLALSFRAVSHVQLPLNLLDWRWREPQIQALFAARDDVTFHARSLFLQGLLAAGEPALWPDIPELDVPGLVGALDALAETLGREGAADLCVAYTRAMPFLHGVVTGAETVAQLETNAALAQKAPLDADEVHFVERFLPRVPETVLNPALWQTAKAA